MKRIAPLSKRDAIEKQNRMAAEIIAADPRRYPGVMAEWAAAILANGSRRRHPHWEAGARAPEQVKQVAASMRTWPTSTHHDHCEG